MVSASSSKQQNIQSIDDLVAIIASADAAAVHDTLIPALTRLHKASGKDKKGDDLLLEQTSDGRDPLDVLQAPYGIGYLQILYARCHASNVDIPTMMIRVAHFAGNCIPQEILCDSPRVFGLAEWLRAEASKVNQLQSIVQPITDLLLRFLSGLKPGTLTPLHRIFAYTCLQARAYGHAHSVLHQRPVYDVDMVWAPITYHDHLLYHYYLGTICAAVGRWSESIDAFEQVVSAPGSAVAAVQLDAYKKLVLVSYLGRGKAAKLPKYSNAAVQNNFKNTYGEPYLNLAEALLDNNIANASAAAQKHAEVFRMDKNEGLVERALERLRPQIILKLTETYVALSLAEIARHLSLDEPDSPQAQQETQRLIRNMIDHREIFAEIQPDASGAGATVAFLPDPEPHNTADAARNIDYLGQRASWIGHITRLRGQEMAASKEFLQKAINQAGQAPSAAGYSAMDEDMLDIGSGMMRGGADDFFDD